MRRWLKTFLNKFSRPLIIRRVSGNSMLPTYKCGQIIFATSLKRASNNSIVIANHKDIEIIKRLKKSDKNISYLAGDNKSSHHDLTVNTSQIHAVVL